MICVKQIKIQTISSLTVDTKGTVLNTTPFIVMAHLGLDLGKPLRVVAEVLRRGLLMAAAIIATTGWTFPPIAGGNTWPDVATAIA